LCFVKSLQLDEAFGRRHWCGLWPHGNHATSSNYHGLMMVCAREAWLLEAGWLLSIAFLP
jgi:triacylglycerol esterase/lipase EstA (alpha/beta hydrolase family)